MERKGTATIIVVLGIAAILFFVVMNSGAKKVSASTTPSGVTNLNGLLGLGGAVVSLFSNKPQAPSSLGTSSYYAQGDSASQAAYGLSHGVVEQEGNQLIDVNTGNALVYGAE